MRRLLPLTALLLVLAGCGNDGDDEAGRTVTLESPDTVQVVGDEYSFDPETIVLTGGELVVELENKGVLAHNLRVLENGADIGGTPTFTGGETRSGTVKVHSGEYELVCTVGNHAELGMTGKLIVR